MTVPGSGEISLGKIRQELESTSVSNDYNEGPYTGSTSLSGSETGVYDTINSGSTSRPDGVGPFKMSEWRSYGHNIAWYVNWSGNLKNNFVLSGSKSNANTAPNNTVADQQVVSFTITNPSAAVIEPPAGTSWDNLSEPIANYVYVYISSAHAHGQAGPYVDSGSVWIAMGAGVDPGTSGTAMGAAAQGATRMSGSGWIPTTYYRGITDSRSSFLDYNGSAPINVPPFMLNVARVKFNPSYQSSSFYVRMAYSGSGENTYGFNDPTYTSDHTGIVGTEHSRSIHMINGPYSSSFDFTTKIVS